MGISCTFSNLCHLSFLFKAHMVTMTAVVKHCSSCSPSAHVKWKHSLLRVKVEWSVPSNLYRFFFLRCCDAIGSWTGRKKASSIWSEATAREITQETRVILPAAGREREAIYRKQVDRVKHESSVVNSYGISSTRDTSISKYVLLWSVMLILSRNNTFIVLMDHIV